MSIDYLIVGLGNPEKKYKYTRHNVGADVAQIFFNIESGHISYKNKKVFVLCSPDYMNVSGGKVLEVFKKLKAKNLIVLVDELDLSFGQIKVTYNGSAKGHNGIRSIISSFGGNSFWKVMIGIGRPEQISISEYVLSKFKPEEIQQIPFVAADFKQALDFIFVHKEKEEENQ